MMEAGLIALGCVLMMVVAVFVGLAVMNLAGRKPRTDAGEVPALRAELEELRRRSSVAGDEQGGGR